MVDHDNIKVSNLHWQFIHTEGRRVTSKARSARDAMRALNSTVFMSSVMDTLTWNITMEIVRVN